MTAVAPDLRCGPVVRAPCIAVLDAVARPTVSLALWERRLPRTVAGWLDGLPAAALPSGRVLVGLADLERAVAAILSDSGTPYGPEARDLIADVRALAGRFAAIARSDVVDVRIEAIADNACRRFHRDVAVLRLLTSYRGPGTEWIAGEHADAALEAQEAYRGPVQRMPPHAVALFRGTLSRAAPGLVHRSPPIAGTGVTRLLLAVNAPSGASPPPWRE